MDPISQGDSQAQLRTLDLNFCEPLFCEPLAGPHDPLHDWNYTHPTPIARKHIPLRGTLSRRMPDAGLHCVTGSHTVKICDAKSFMFDGLCGHSALAYRYQRYLL